MREPKLGTGLSSEDFESGRIFSVSYAPRAEYAWDTGPAIGRYLEELKAGRIVGRSCRKCNRVFVPPREFCELCFRPADDWVPLEDTGRINTFSLCYITWDMKKLTSPEIPAVIEIDGATPGHGIMHLIGGVDPAEVKVGMKVKAVWKPENEREGAITDIRYWKPFQ
jgi:uncharacterized OB-fold protein